MWQYLKKKLQPMMEELKLPLLRTEYFQIPFPLLDFVQPGQIKIWAKAHGPVTAHLAM